MIFPNAQVTACFHYAACFTLGTLFLISTPEANAIVILDENDIIENFTDPGGSLPWDTVGIRDGSGASATYLGGGWVLTAGHVGAGPTTFNGITYQMDNSIGQIQISPSTSLDLVMYRLTALPSLPGNTIYSGGTLTGSQTTMVGYGTSRLSYQNNGTPGNPNDDYFPWQFHSPTIKRWGTNIITGQASDTNGNSLIYTTADRIGTTDSTPNEAQVSTGDSGGAFFHWTGTEYQLAGIIVGTNAGGTDGQAEYGDLSFAVDLRHYAAEIQSNIDTHGVLVPEPSSTLLIALAGLASLLRRKR